MNGRRRRRRAQSDKWQQRAAGKLFEFSATGATLESGGPVAGAAEFAAQIKGVGGGGRRGSDEHTIPLAEQHKGSWIDDAASWQATRARLSSENSFWLLKRRLASRAPPYEKSEPLN